MEDKSKRTSSSSRRDPDVSRLTSDVPPGTSHVSRSTSHVPPDPSDVSRLTSNVSPSPSNVKTHRDLDVWKEGIELVGNVYKVLEKFPGQERYGLMDQIKRSAISIPSNIAEGAARQSSKEFIRFLYVSLGSIAELETQLIISKNLGFFSDEAIFENVERLKSKLLGLVRCVKGKQNAK
jgi:four helix bundle protein